MNKNVESHFSLMPQVDMPRSTFDRSSTHCTTFNVGELIPVYIDEVLPGDTYKVTTAKQIRLQTLIAPLFGTLYAEFHHWFIPNRLIFDHWQELMGENKDSAWIPEREYTTPQIALNALKPVGSDNNITKSTGLPTGSLADYMGIPVGVGGSLSVNALPFRAYAKVWEDWWKDQNVQQPLNIYTGDATKYFSDDPADELSEFYIYPRKAARFHDEFSSCLPSPQKGPDVSIPMSGQVSWLPVHTLTEDVGVVDPVTMTFLGSGENDLLLYRNTSNTNLSAKVAGEHTGFEDLVPNNLWAQYDISNVTMANINDLRTAFQIQRLYERDAFGSRYIELLKSHFGVTSPDARLQRSEYLGGNRVALNVHQVVNSSEGENAFLGNLGAMSHTSDVHEDVVKSFVEHGWYLITCVVRYENTYSQGLEPFWKRSDRFSYYWPVFSHLGNTAVKNETIYAQGNPTDDEVFGYQEYAYEYRYKQNRVSAEMRPGISNSLAVWNLADYYTELPTLSDGWIQSNKNIVDRVLAVTSDVSNQILLDLYVKNICTRVMPMYSVPGLIDHF